MKSTSTGPMLIPSSLQRVRCFMNTRGRLNLKPWADVNETLEAFYSMLVVQTRRDSFWDDLESLLTDLSVDLKRRLSAGAGEVIHNEVLNAERFGVLLGEIRRAMNHSRAPKGAIRKLAEVLSAPAMGVLLLLGGVASLGCAETESTGKEEPIFETDDGSGVAHDPDSSPADGGGDSETGGAQDETDSENGAEDAGQAKNIEEIVESVMADEPEREEVLDCIGALHESWRTGLEELFEGQHDNQIATYLRCLLRDGDENGRWCENPARTGEFDLDAFLDNCAVLVYLGVRFE